MATIAVTQLSRTPAFVCAKPFFEWSANAAKSNLPKPKSGNASDIHAHAFAIFFTFLIFSIFGSTFEMRNGSDKYSAIQLRASLAGFPHLTSPTLSRQ